MDIYLIAIKKNQPQVKVEILVGIILTVNKYFIDTYY